MSKKNANQTSKTTKNRLNYREEKLNAKRRAQQAADRKKLLVGGGIALGLIAVLSVILVWYYRVPTVARIDGTRLSAEDLNRTMSMGEQRFWHQPDADFTNWERGVREEAVIAAALISLYEDYGRRIGVPLTGNESPMLIIDAVTSAIVNDPVEFARFEVYMPEDMLPEALAKATSILERLRAGEDFDTLMHTYSEDIGGLQNHPYGYTFVDWQMVPEFSEGTKALEIGEISDLVQSDFGFHIIQRIEPDPYNIMDNVSAPDGVLLGAKHILILSGPTHDERMRQAVATWFEAELEQMNIVFLPALYDVP